MGKWVKGANLIKIYKSSRKTVYLIGELHFDKKCIVDPYEILIEDLFKERLQHSTQKVAVFVETSVNAQSEMIQKSGVYQITQAFSECLTKMTARKECEKYNSTFYDADTRHNLPNYINFEHLLISPSEWEKYPVDFSLLRNPMELLKTAGIAEEFFTPTFFQFRKKVMKQYNRYYETITKSPVNFDNIQSKLESQDSLKEIGEFLKYVRFIYANTMDVCMMMDLYLTKAPIIIIVAGTAHILNVENYLQNIYEKTYEYVNPDGFDCIPLEKFEFI